MIRTVAGLLESLKQREMELIAQSGIRHAPTMGAQYEGLTSDLLRRIIPEYLGLSVVSGFVKGHDGVLSGQIDCMLVYGTGTAVPQTSLFIWPIRQVIALFEVKKTLFSTELEEAHHHLNAVLDIYIAFARSLGPEVSLNLEPALHAFGQIVGHRAPERSHVASLPYTQQMLYQTLITEQFAPLRIVFGYQGYASEYTLRTGFLDFLERNPRVAGFGTTSLPSLIVCGGNSIVKLNGHPYALGMRGEEWTVFASSSENPMLLLLKLIWTKLSYAFKLPAWFDYDLGMERFSPLLSGIAVQGEELSGWEYNAHEYSRQQLESRGASPDREWRPLTVTPFQEAILYALGASDGISPAQLAALQASEVSADPGGELQMLLDRRLVGYNGDRLVFLTLECATVITPWGETLAGDNGDGRLFAWVMREEARRNGEVS